MTETWCPREQEVVKCISDSYTGCEERPLVGQLGRVKSVYEFKGEKVLVIAFTATPSNRPTLVDGIPKTIFYEYFAVSRKPYLYFNPSSHNWSKNN